MTFLGYFLGKVFNAKQIERVVILIIIVSVMPIVIGAIKHRMEAKKNGNPTGGDTPATTRTGEAP
jgi:membrane-associated protein